MHRNRFASMVAIATFAGAVVTGGCVWAASEPPAAAATAAARAAAAASRVLRRCGHVTFL